MRVLLLLCRGKYHQETRSRSVLITNPRNRLDSFGHWTELHMLTLYRFDPMLSYNQNLIYRVWIQGEVDFNYVVVTIAIANRWRFPSRIHIE
jgi:hypothetical protein